MLLEVPIRRVGRVPFPINGGERTDAASVHILGLFHTLPNLRVCEISAADDLTESELLTCKALVSL